MGLENDASWTNLRGATQDLPPFNVQATSSTRETWIDTLRGRVGYALDRFLVYGTAGVAFAGTKVTVTNGDGPFSDSKTRTGLAVGVGGEWAAWTGSWGAVSFKLEYLHADFGSKQYINPPISTGAFTVVTRDVKLTDDIVRAGVNVRFNWDGTVIAK
jgi:outer membrane immunogenic protein